MVETVLVVEDHGAAAAAIVRAIPAHVAALHVPNIREAVQTFETRARNWVGAIIDIGLPDGSGLDLARRLRSAKPAFPLLVLTGREDRQCANEAQSVGAHFAYKPVTVSEIDAFVGRALEAVPGRRVSKALRALALDKGLSRRETTIVRLLVQGASREELANRLGVSNNTLKTQVRSVLGKCGAPSLGAVVQAVLQAAISGTP